QTRTSALTILSITATPTPANSPTRTNTATLTPTLTNTATPSITSTPTITPTPTVPTLVNVALAPTTAFMGSSIVLTYTVFSPSAQQVGLGADMAPDGSGTFVD